MLLLYVSAALPMRPAGLHYYFDMWTELLMKPFSSILNDIKQFWAKPNAYLKASTLRSKMMTSERFMRHMKKVALASSREKARCAWPQNDLRQPTRR